MPMSLMFSSFIEAEHFKDIQSEMILLHQRAFPLWTAVRRNSSRFHHVDDTRSNSEDGSTEDTRMTLQSYPKDFHVLVDHPKFLILNKNCGVGIQDDSKHMGPSRWRKGIATVLKELDPEIRSVHRLDKNVTGGVAFARDLHTANMISRNLRMGGNSGYKFIRRYVAIVKLGNLMPVAECISYVPGDKRNSKGTITTTDEKGFAERTQFIISGSRHDAYQLVVIQLMTGRKHQIRRHFSQICGMPLLNDTRYGGGTPPTNEHTEVAIGLHSAFVSLQVGLQKFPTLVPIHYAQGIWTGFVNDAGEFDEEVKDLLQNFDERFGQA